MLGWSCSPWDQTAWGETFFHHAEYLLGSNPAAPMTGVCFWLGNWEGTSLLIAEPSLVARFQHPAMVTLT